MFDQINIFQNGIDKYVRSLGLKSYAYGNATHAFADILRFLKEVDDVSSTNILLPSYIPAKLYKTSLSYGIESRFYEIDQNCSFNMKEIEQIVDSNTRVIFAIHYFGYPAKIKLLREFADINNILLIEDCAHVIYGRETGGRLGTWGDVSIFSPRKMLNLPEGGYLVFNRKFQNFHPTYEKRVNWLYTLSKLIQTRGKYFYLTLTNGNDIFNLSKVPKRGYIDYSRVRKSQIKKISRLTSFYSKTVDIRTQIEKRQQNYSYLYKSLKEIFFLKPVYKEFPITWTPYSLPIIVKGGYRDQLQQELAKEGISCGAGWPESPFDERFTKTSELSNSLIEFPVHPFITKNQLNKILEVCREFDKSISIRLKNIPAKIRSNNEIIIPAFSNTGKVYGMRWKNDHPEHLTFQSASELDKRLEPIEHIRTEIIKTEHGFDNLKIVWDSLCEESNVKLFQTFEWQRLWWKYFGNGKELYLILFYSENNFRVNELVGIAPFFIDTKYLGGIRILRRLRLIGSGVEKDETGYGNYEYGASDYLDLIVRKDYEKRVVEILTNYLKSHSTDFDVVQLDEVYSDSIVLKQLLPLLDKSGWKYNLSRGEICPRIYLEKTLNGYLAKLDTKVRYQLKKILRDLYDSSSLSKKTISLTDDFEKSFNDFVDLHQKRWNNKGLPGLFSDNRYKDFLKEVTQTFLEKGLLHFTAIYADGKCLAAECAFKYKNYYYDYSKALDTQSPFARFRPGKALLLLLIENAIENDAEVVDLLRGSENYKFEFTSDWIWTHKLIISNPVANHSARYSFFLYVKFFTRVKYQFVNEFRVMIAHIRNSGLSGLTMKYLPSTIRKIKQKLNELIFKNFFNDHRDDKDVAFINKPGSRNNSKTSGNFQIGVKALYRERNT